MAKDSPILPIAGGAAGAVIAVTAADKLGANPTWAAWGTAAAGAATALGTKGVVQRVAMGVGAAGVCLGAIQLISAAKASKAKKETAQQKRQADGEPFITRSELNDAVTRLAELQKQGQCDLVTSLRDEIKKVVVETTKPTARIYQFPQRAAAGDDERNAVIEDEYMRNAYGDEERNAFAEDERNAFVEDEYMRNAYGDEERNASRFGGMAAGNQRVTYAQPVGVRTVPADEFAGYDGFDDQAAYYDDARNAYADDERNAYADDERNAYVDDERNAYAEEAAAA